MNAKQIQSVKLTKLVSHYFVDTKLTVAFKPPSDIGKQFPFKDKTDQKTGVVYHFKCKNCTANYVGKTKRNLNTRIREHQTTKNSSIFKHTTLEKHEFDFDNVEILDRDNSEKRLDLKEMLYIRKLQPELNKQEDSQLFTLIIRNQRKPNDITNDRQRYVSNKNNNNKNNQ